MGVGRLETVREPGQALRHPTPQGLYEQRVSASVAASDTLGLDPSPAHMGHLHCHRIHRARPCGGPFCTVAAPAARRSQRRDRRRVAGPPCPRRSKRGS
jgi:hypothetical protein